MSSINWTNVTTFDGFLQSANTATSGTFWGGTLFMLFIVMTMTLIGFGFETAVMGGAFFALLAGIMMLYLGLVSYWVVGIFVGILLSFFLYVILTSPKS